MKSLGARLEATLKRRGLTQTELADRIGVSQPTVARWAKGERPNLSARDLFAAADALGVNPRWLLDGSDEVEAGPPGAKQPRVDAEFAGFAWPAGFPEQTKLEILMKVAAERESLRAALVAYWHARLRALVDESAGPR